MSEDAREKGYFFGEAWGFGTGKERRISPLLQKGIGGLQESIAKYIYLFLTYNNLYPHLGSSIKIFEYEGPQQFCFNIRIVTA